MRLQGVGKGTYSTRIADYFGMEHIASGDLVRDEMRKGTEIGKEVRWRGLCGGGGGGGGRAAQRFVWCGVVYERKGLSWHAGQALKLPSSHARLLHRQSPPHHFADPPAFLPARPVPPACLLLHRPQMKDCVNKGNLLPDTLILRVIRDHFMKAHSEGTDRFLLDGFPRTQQQAEALEQIADVQLAVNLSLREEVRPRQQCPPACLACLPV